MRILILGAGAVGGYCGARLMEKGADVTFLVRPARYTRLMQDRLRICSPHGDLALPVQAVTAAALQAQGRRKGGRGFDCVILAAKAYDLESALDAVAPVMAANAACRIIPLLNGLAHYERLDARFGQQRTLGGLCHMPMVLEEDGTIRHLSTLHRLMIGPRHPDQASDGPVLEALFAGARIDFSLSHDIMQDAWEKYVFLSVLAASTCLMRATIGAINRQPDGTAFIRGLLDEATAVASGAGHLPRPAAIDEYCRQLFDPASLMDASMARDAAKGTRTESQAILGDMLARGAQLGLTMPLMGLARLYLALHDERVLEAYARMQ
jgi:2-dehydropantoate 2-reductase